MDKANVTDATVPKNNSRFKHKGRLKPISGFQTTFVLIIFVDGVQATFFVLPNSLRSVGYAHELPNISDDLSYTFPHRQYRASLLSALFHLPFEACACGMVEGAGGELAGDL